MGRGVNLANETNATASDAVDERGDGEMPADWGELEAKVPGHGSGSHPGTVKESRTSVLKLRNLVGEARRRWGERSGAGR
jgi:hypothetical protein